MAIYLAGPLFSEAELDWCRKVAETLRGHGCSVVWPGELLAQEEIEDAEAGAEEGEAPALIFDRCLGALQDCSLVVAILDGTQVDDGTAWEIGFAFARGIPVYGIRTDIRAAGETQVGNVNAMIEESLAGYAMSLAELLELLAVA